MIKSIDELLLQLLTEGSRPISIVERMIGEMKINKENLFPRF